MQPAEADGNLAQASATTADHDDGAQPAEPAIDKRAEVPYDVAFRLIVYYHLDKGQYGVRCEELGDLEVFAASRAEALREGEAMLESKIAACAVKGETLPKPFDFEQPRDYSGRLELEISRSLHRDLALAARRERLSIDRLCAELLARGIEGRGRGARPDRPADGAWKSPPGGDRPSRDRRDSDPDRGRRGMSRDRYQHVMEDKAAFLEYVRSMDQGNSGSRGGRGGGNERGGGGGGGRGWRNR
jgi:predicted HicB family RNase H-like nuclease